MSGKKLKGAFSRLRRAFSAKDEKAFDEALEEVEEAKADDEGEGKEDIVVHNHIPADDVTEPMGVIHDRRDHLSEGSLKAYGTQHEPDSPMQSYQSNDDMQEPPWFAKHKAETDDRFKALHDNFRSMHDELKGGLAKWAKEEEAEPEHTDDEELKKEANKKILGELEFEAPPGTGDKATKAKDSSYLADSFQQTVSKAEVLVPGVRLPTFDRKAPPSKSFEAIDSLRRTTLDLAWTKAETRGLIDTAMGGKPLDIKTMRAGDVRTLFNAVAGMMAMNNNNSMRGGGSSQIDGTGIPLNRGRIQSIADINRTNKERFSTRKSA